MCGFSVATEIGVSVGGEFMLDGNKEKIMIALYNMVDSISGFICPGAKDGFI